jgi:hypothetical protein
MWIMPFHNLDSYDYVSLSPDDLEMTINLCACVLGKGVSVKVWPFFTQQCKTHSMQLKAYEN